MDGIGYWSGMVGIFEESRSFPLISVYLSRAGSRMGAARASLGAILVVLAGRWEDLGEGAWAFGVWMWALVWLARWVAGWIWVTG